MIGSTPAPGARHLERMAEQHGQTYDPQEEPAPRADGSEWGGGRTLSTWRVRAGRMLQPGASAQHRFVKPAPASL